jgi:O-antigen/teichoic acid export membrane protein
MSAIRRQSIISSLVIYVGFAVGMLNVYFFTKESLFTTDQYGLTQVFIAISAMMQAVAAFGMPSFIFKFYPYYSHHLPNRKNDMLSLSLIVGLAGFVMVAIGGWLFQDLVIKKYNSNAPQLVNYYFWIFPMGLGLTIYSILEAYTQSIRKPVITNFLREVQWRLWTTVLIVLFIFHVIVDFGVFIKLYVFGYLLAAISLLIYLAATGKLHLSFSISKVTRRFSGKIISFCLFVYSGMLVFTLSGIFDTLVIASVLKDGLKKAAIFTLAQTMASIIQAPQRGVIAASIARLSQAWKDKDLWTLQKIYQRSSINLLLFAAGIFVLIALNFTEAVYTFKLKPEYALGFNAFLFIGLTKVIDLGTGLNAQIIGTSNYWRFELISGIILLLVTLPLTYIMAKQYGIIGPAMAMLVSVSLYNMIRLVFLYKKFRLQPFTVASLYTALIAGCGYVVCYFAFKKLHGFTGLFLRSTAFILLYGWSVIYFRLSPDVQPVWQSIKKRLGM